MDERALRGIPWTLLTFGATKLLGLLTTVVLARLLVPEDFGLFALATLASLFLTIFRDFGLGSVLIVRQDYDMQSRATVVTMMLLFGVLAAVIVVALSPLAALAFDEPRLSGVLAALSATLVFGGVAWSYEVIMQRELAFKPRFAAQMVQSLTYTVVALALAVAGAGVWSLVGGALAGGAAASVAFLALAPYRLPLRLDRGVARDALRSGRGFIGQGVLALIRQNADYLVIGRLLGARSLGLYTLAYRFSEMPYVGIADPVGKVLFPALSKMRHAGEEVADAFLGAQRMVALVTCPLGVILSATAEPFVDAILGPKWTGMVPALTILGLWGAFRPLENTVALLLNAVGEADLVAKVLAVVLAVLIPSFVVAAHFGGLAAVAAVTLAEMVVTLPVLWSFTRPHIGVSLTGQWRSLRTIAIACPAAWLAARGMAELLDEIAPAATLAASVAAGVLVYLAVVSLAEPGLLRQSRDQILRMLRRTPAPGVGAP